MRYYSFVLLAAAVSLGCDNSAQSRYDRETETTSSSDAADNSQALKTPFDQNENNTDTDTTAEIRQRVVDTEMSTNAHNVKIITQNGKVTLRGPVPSQTEKQQIEEIALAVAGRGNVDNQLEVQLQ